MNFYKKLTDNINKLILAGGGLLTVEALLNKFKGEDLSKKMDTIIESINKVKEKSFLDKIKEDEQTDKWVKMKSMLIDEEANKALLTDQGNKITNKIKEVQDLSLKINTDTSPETNSELQNQIQKLNYSFEEFGKTLKDRENIGTRFKELYDSMSKPGGGPNFTESISEKIAQYKEFPSHLETQQVGALGHLIFWSLILLCLVSIIFIFYGEWLVVRFKIETKYPRIAVYIGLRRKFQQFYLLSNISMIAFSVFVLMYVNLFVFFHNF